MPVGGLGELKLKLRFVDVDRAMKDLEKSFRPLVEKVFGGLKFDTKAGEGAVSGVMKILGVAIAINYGIQSIARILQRVSPLLESMLDLFSQAISLILKPIGDFVAILLRPFILFFFRYVTIPLLQFLTKGYPMVNKMADTLDKILNSLPGWAKGALGGAMLLGGIGFLMGGPAGMLAGVGLGAFLGFLFSFDWSGLLDSIKEGLDVLGKLGSWIWDNIKKIIDFGGDIWNDLKNFGQWLFDQIKGILDFGGSIWDNLANFGQWLFDKIEDILDFGGDIWNDLSNFGQWLFDQIESILDFGGDIWNDLSNFGQWLFDQIKEILNFDDESKWGDLKNFGQWLFDKIKETLAFGSDVWKSLSDFGQWLFDKIVEKIKGGLDILKDLGKKIWDWILEKLGLRKPDKDSRRNIRWRTEDVDDFIISKGRIIRTNPEDIIFGVKKENLGRLGNLNITINVNVDKVSSEIDIENMARMVSERLASDLYRYGRW